MDWQSWIDLIAYGGMDPLILNRDPSLTHSFRWNCVPRIVDGRACCDQVPQVLLAGSAQPLGQRGDLIPFCVASQRRSGVVLLILE